MGSLTFNYFVMIIQICQISYRVFRYEIDRFISLLCSLCVDSPPPSEPADRLQTKSDMIVMSLQEMDQSRY
jgi:hypothetical protein